MLLLLVDVPLVDIFLLSVNWVFLVVLVLEYLLSVKIIESSDLYVDLPQFIIFFWCAAEAVIDVVNYNQKGAFSYPKFVQDKLTSIILN